MEASVATPVTLSVEDAVKAPADVSDVWNVEAPVIPIPPAVTNNAAEWLATPAKLVVEPNTAAPVIPSPDPTFKFPETPKPPMIVKAPFVDDVEFVFTGILTKPVVPTTILSVAELLATILMLFGEKVPNTRSPVCEATYTAFGKFKLPEPVKLLLFIPKFPKNDDPVPILLETTKSAEALVAGEVF